MLNDWTYRLRQLLRRDSAEADLQDELAFHLERETEKLVRAGMGPEQARREARLAAGGLAQIQEAVREQWNWGWCADLWQDARYAVRAMKQSPVFAGVAVLSLALGIGANAAIFGVLDAVLMKPLPVREPGRLVHFSRKNDDSFTYPIWEQVRDRQDVFSGVFAYGNGRFDLASGGEKKPAQGLFVSGDYFRTLGVAPLLGRTITKEDDRVGGGSANAVAVLSYAFWQRAYGGDPHIVERSIRLDGLPFQVIGVMPRGFFGVEVGQSFDVIVPVTSVTLLHPKGGELEGRSHWWLTLMGRLGDGVGMQQAAARLKALAPLVYQASLPTDIPVEFQKGFLAGRLDIAPAETGISNLRARYGRALLVLMGIVGLVLLIACVNIANLLLARASARGREIAVRLAMGAGRFRLVRQLLTESILLSLIGTACGVVLARIGGPLIVSLISEPGEAQFLDLTPDWRVVSFAVGAAILTGMLFGLAPALRATRLTTAEALKQGSRGLTERRGGWSPGRLLVMAQVALSLLLLVGAGLFAGSLRKLVKQDLGFQAEGVLLMVPDLRGGKFSSETEDLVVEDLLARARAIPGVRSASRSAETPVDGGSWQWDIRLKTPDGGRKKAHAWVNLVSPGYFQTMRTPLLRGRDVAAGDRANSPHVAILNETAAREYFPGVDPVGKFYYDEAFQQGAKEFPVQVIGLVKDAKYRTLRDAAPPTIYLPITQTPTPESEIGIFELRYEGSSAGVIAGMKEAAREADPRISLEFRSLATQVSNSLLQERLVATLAACFGLLALVLASAGLYGVVSYAAARRRNEMAIRMALGSSRGGVLGLMLRDLASLVAIGIPLGLAAAWGCARLLHTMLWGLTPGDPATMAGAAGLLSGMALVAGYLPARRAARQDPMASLREE
ncbi:MAG TPA: ABC transporter permease [Candidatus Sulfopaludibacter sp.]|jgi:predicted permease|nr:ABC transporter permease [Candidatus Sulfopaludibacter sp.]